MCGICGFVSKRDISLMQLHSMNDTMYHRGPDDSGEEIYEALGDGYSVGFAHRRLSILDLTSFGHQPMHSINGRVSIVYNGEIYNFKELKQKLNDYPFQSNCDTEVILAAYMKWGIRCVEHFNGMFAIAIFDRETNEVYLIRDRIGKKPLYYWLDGENLVFASELKAIIKCPGFSKNIRSDVVSRYLCNGYINAPESIFKDVYKLQAGAILKFYNGICETWKYWDINEIYAKQIKNLVSDYETAKLELKALLKSSVARRMISDVPLGTFLSGGYDSSLITAMAQEVSDKPVKTYCIGFEESEFNEANFAKEIAAYLGTNHTELYINLKQMIDLVDDIPYYYDEPFADSSQIPTMLVSALAKEHVTVVLSGDGGDEFFCGYNLYERVYQAQKLEIVSNALYKLFNMPYISKLNIINKLPNSVQMILNNRSGDTKTQFFVDNYIGLAYKMVQCDYSIPCKYEIEQIYNEKDWQIRRMLLDMDTYLSGDILCKVDRASMKYSLEARCPILDRDVMEYSFRIPHKYKYRNGGGKYILKDILYDYIPRELLDRPKKGFSVPLERWLRGPLKESLLDFSEFNFLKNQGIFRAEYVSALVQNYVRNGDKGVGAGKRYSTIIWSFFVFQQWYKWLRNI